MLKITTPFIILLLFGTSFAQQSTVEMDAISFVRDSGKIQVEIYYSIVQGALRFEQKGNTWVAPINGRAELWHDGKVVAAQNIRKEKIIKGSKASVDSTQASLELSGVVLIGQVRSNDDAVLIFLSKNDKGGDVYDTISRKLFVPVTDKDKFFLGGVELATTLQATTDRSNPFEKVGYVITPNPSKVYNASNSRLNYYTELYIPTTSISSSSSVEIITRVLDGQKHEMFSNSHSQPLAAATIPLIGSIDIDGLPTDSYILEIAVKRGANIEATIQKAFYFDSGLKLSEDQTDAPAAAALDEESVYSTSDLSRMAELELFEKGEQAMYIGKADQVKAWKKLQKKVEEDEDHESSASSDPEKVTAQKAKEQDIAQQRKFLFSFWRDKDKEQGNRTPLQAYNQYYRKVEDVNKKYTHQKTPGWETDFGRIYLTYGVPDERYIKSELHNIDAKPYVTWEYYDRTFGLQTGSHALFVFVDKQGGGKFVLVHSNVQGEVYEPDWYAQEALRTH